MRNINKFAEDINEVFIKLSKNASDEVTKILHKLKEKLIDLHVKGLVKINHSVMELIVAKQLILKGYSIDVEYKLTENLTCDVLGVKGDGKMIVEIETGYTPPEHALDPQTYIKARIASKIARYSGYANKFALAFPPYFFPEIPAIYLKPPRFRSREEVMDVKKLCDLYYKKPPVSINEILNARLHTIFIIDVDSAEVVEVDPEAYNEVYTTYSRSILRK